MGVKNFPLYKVTEHAKDRILTRFNITKEEAINTAVHNVLPGLRGERLAYEREVASAELIKASMFDKPTMII